MRAKAERSGRQLRMAVVSVVIALAMAVLGVFSYRNAQDARAQTTKAVENLGTSDHAGRLLPNGKWLPRARLPQRQFRQAGEAKQRRIAQTRAAEPRNSARRRREPQKCEKQRKIALAQSLAAQAPNINIDNELSTLLAVQAFHLAGESLGPAGWLIDRPCVRHCRDPFTRTRSTGTSQGSPRWPLAPMDAGWPPAVPTTLCACGTRANPRIRLTSTSIRACSVT